MPEEIKLNLAQKMSLIAKEVAYVQKDGKNSFQNYKYATAEAVLGKVNEARTCLDVAMQVQVASISFEEMQTKNGPCKMAVVHVRYTFINGDDPKEQIFADGVGSGLDTGDKGISKALTMAHKYAMAQAFTISWGDDPEADTRTDEVTSVKPGNGTKATPDSATELTLEISTAKNLDELRLIQKKVLDRKGKADYDGLVAAYKTQQTKLEKSSQIPGQGLRR